MAVTYLKNCTLLDTASETVTENGLLCLCHRGAEEAPDPIGYCGSVNHPSAPDFTTGLAADDFTLDMQNTTLLPGLIDLDAGLPSGFGKNEAYDALLTYRRTAQSFVKGVLSCGFITPNEGEKQAERVARALSRSSSSFLLWGPRIEALKALPDHEGYWILQGLPEKAVREEEDCLKAIRAAKERGMRPAVATLSLAVNQAQSFALVRSAQLLVLGGYTPMEALQAITVNNAKLLGIDNVTAHLQPGYEGDVLAVDGNPLADLTALERVVLAARGGRLIFSKLSGFERSRFAILPPGYEL